MDAILIAIPSDPLDLQALHDNALRAVVRYGTVGDLIRFIADTYRGGVEIQVAVCNAALARFPGPMCQRCQDTRYIKTQCSIDSGPHSREWQETENCPDCCCLTCGGLKDSAYCLCQPEFRDELPL